MIYRDTKNITKFVSIILGILFLLVLVVIFAPKVISALNPSPTPEGYAKLFTSTPINYPTLVPSSTPPVGDAPTPNIELTSWWLTATAAPQVSPTFSTKPMTATPPPLLASKFVDTPVVSSRNSPSHPMINVDAKNNVHILWVDKSEADTGDIFDTENTFGTWSKPKNLTTEGPLPENISLKSLTLLRSPVYKFLYLYWSGFPAYGDVYGGFYERRFSEDHWYGRRQVIQTLGLTKYEISPSFSMDGVMHTFSNLDESRIDWISLDKSFADTQFSAFDKPILLLDKDKTFHVISTTNNHMDDRYSYLHSEVQYRTWKLDDLGESLGFDAYINNHGQAIAVYANYDMVFKLSTFNKTTLWSDPLTFDPMNGWDKNDRVIWWKIISNSNYQYIIFYHKSQTIRFLDITDGHLTISKKTLSLNPLKTPKENIDATLDDKNVIHIAALNNTDNGIYQFTINQ